MKKYCVKVKFGLFVHSFRTHVRVRPTLIFSLEPVINELITDFPELTDLFTHFTVNYVILLDIKTRDY